MPGLDRVLDPRTGDYVDDDETGECVETPTIATGIYHQLQDELGHWPGDSEAGSDLYTLEREDNTPETRQRAGAIITVALKPFVDAGVAANLVVDSEATGVNRSQVRSSIHDVQQQVGEELDITAMTSWGP